MNVCLYPDRHRHPPAASCPPPMMPSRAASSSCSPPRVAAEVSKQRPAYQCWEWLPGPGPSAETSDPAAVPAASEPPSPAGCSRGHQGLLCPSCTSERGMPGPHRCCSEHGSAESARSFGPSSHALAAGMPGAGAAVEAAAAFRSRTSASSAAVQAAAPSCAALTGACLGDAPLSSSSMMACCPVLCGLLSLLLGCPAGLCRGPGSALAAAGGLARGTPPAWHSLSGSGLWLE